MPQEKDPTVGEVVEKIRVTIEKVTRNETYPLETQYRNKKTGRIIDYYAITDEQKKDTETYERVCTMKGGKVIEERIEKIYVQEFDSEDVNVSKVAVGLNS